MATLFQQIASRVLDLEGGYVDHPSDRGGETICGVSRRAWPGWEGWAEVDVMKARGERPRVTPSLRRAALRLYRDQFWDALQGDQLRDEAVAEELFRFAIHADRRPAGRLLQECLNLLNRGARSWPELVVDGWIGPQTLEMLRRAYLERHGRRDVARLLHHLVGEYYIEIVRKHASQEDFVRGWLDRIAPH